MRTLIRFLVRVAALLLLVGLLVGLPIVVLLAVGAPWPSSAQWRDAWQSRTVGTDVVVRLGAALFLLLWVWFAATALAEAGRVLMARRDPARLATLPSGDGPVRWVRSLVRLAAIGSVSASAVMGGLAGHGLAASAHRAATAPPALATHVVVAGDSYWAIADAHLTEVFGREPTAAEVHVATEALMSWNAGRLGHRDPALIVPGETVMLEPPAASVQAVPAAEVVIDEPVVTAPVVAEVTVPTAVPTLPSTAPIVPTTVPTSPTLTVPAEAVSVSSPAVEYDDGLGVAELGLAALLSAGALAAVRVGRRRRLEGSRPGDALPVPTFEQTRTELQLRTLRADERVARVDLALRAAAHDLAAQHATVLAVTVGERGEVRLHLRGAAVPGDARWQLDVLRCTWTLGAQVSLAELGLAAGDTLQPCPALWHVGNSPDGGDVYVDVEAWGVVAIDSPAATAVLSAAVASFAYSPFREQSKLLVAGVASDPRLPDVERLGDVADALPVAVGAAAGVALAARHASTLELRAAAMGEAYEPTVLVIDAPIDIDQLAEIGGGRGLAVVLRGAVDAPCVLRATGDVHVLDPLGIEVRPVGLDATQVRAVVDLVQAATEPLTAAEPTVDTFIDVTRTSYEEPEWDLMVKVLGPVDVVSAAGTRVEFDRAKALELVVWLSQHRQRPTRSSARAELWDVGVRDASFANVVSEARRAMARAVPPPEGEEWIGRTLTDDLPLHPRVVTDAELLALRVTAARSMPRSIALEVLREGLAMVTDLPFAGTSYLWPDAGGHTSSLVLLATGAATQLAEWYLEADDIDGVFWATGFGLRVLPGHEELIALRMRAHAARGDLAGVRQEWETYERSLLADSWSLAAPSPKLTTLRRDLLATPVAR